MRTLTEQRIDMLTVYKTLHVYCYDTCMTRTPPDETRGDLKARVQRKQNALKTSFFRGVWPAVPMVFSAL